MLYIPHTLIKYSHCNLFVLNVIHRNLGQYNSFLCKQALFPSDHHTTIQLQPWRVGWAREAAASPASQLWELPPCPLHALSPLWLCLFIAPGQEETKQLWSLLRGSSYDIKGDLATSSSIYSTSFQTGANPSFQAKSTTLWMQSVGTQKSSSPQRLFITQVWKHSISHLLTC